MDRPYHHLSSALDIESSLPAGRRLCCLPAVKLAKDRHNNRKIGKRFAKPNAQGPRLSGAMNVDLTRIIVAEFARGWVVLDGAPFGRYRLIELLGCGGMGEQSAKMRPAPPAIAEYRISVRSFRIVVPAISISAGQRGLPHPMSRPLGELATPALGYDG
jgi:hypothetical protein